MDIDIQAIMVQPEEGYYFFVANVAPGILNISNSDHDTAQSFYLFQSPQDRNSKIKVSVEAVVPGERVPIPASVINNTCVFVAGTKPDLLGLGRFDSYLVRIREGSVLRCEYWTQARGQRHPQKSVKYFTCY